MKQKYFVDLDGVVRNFHKTMRRFPGLENCYKWRERLPDDFWLDIQLNPKKYMYDAEPYQEVVDYIKNVIGIENVVFLSNQCYIEQREFWSVKFIEKHFGPGCLCLFVGNFQEKLNIMKNNPSYHLIEDYPFFWEKEGFNKINHRIHIIPRPWNEDYLHKYKNILEDLGD